MPPAGATHHLDVTSDVVEGGVALAGLDRLPLVQQRVHQVRVVGQLRRQTRVDDLQQHLHHVLQHSHVLIAAPHSVKRRTPNDDTNT